MKRIGALAAALVLTATLAATVAAAPRSTFNGDFDLLRDGNVVAHVTARLWSTDFTSPAGTFGSTNPNGSYSIGQVGETAFYSEPYDNVWFKALEIGFLTEGLPIYGSFVGHFVDLPGSDETDYVEFWGQDLNGEPVPWGGLTLGTSYYYRFDVGEGAFAMHVAD